MDLSKAAVIYTRISRDASGDGEGVDRQEHLCRELADRLHLDVVAVYSDNDIGASERTSTKKVRTGFNEMIAAAHRKEFTHILAYSNSRLTRRMRELEDLIQLHEQTRVLIRTVVSGDDDLSTGDGRMVARIKASVDAAESDRISERQQAAFLHNAQAGKPKLQRQRPFGWKEDGVTIEPDEAQHMREAVEQIKQGVSITMLCKEWMRAGIKTASGNDKWEWTTMRNVLLGWRAAGVRTYRREPLPDGAGGYVQGIWEPIISLEDREAALAMLKKRGLTKVRQGKWLLKGLVTCGECGGKMYGQLTKAKAYSCKDGSGHVAISAERLEQWVEGHLVTHITDRMDKEREGGKLQHSQEPAEWPHEAKLRRVDEKMAELMSAYNNDELSGEVVFPQIKKFEAERNELRRERDDFYALQAQPTTNYNSFEEIVDWGLDNVAIKDGDDEATIDKKRSFFVREIETVIVKKGKRGRAGWGHASLDRIEVVWREQAQAEPARHADTAE